ncbi:MAG: hypothetical protein ACOZQL_10750 [Myxococcota bacterium]
MTVLSQRWRDRRARYRPPGEVITTSEYEVAQLAGDTAAKAFVVRHHYSGTYPAARWRFGLFRRGEIAGVAVFSHPCSDRVLTSVFPGPARDSVELGRLVLLDDVPTNGESWFLGQVFRALKREGVAGVLSFSDPIPRRDAAGVLTMPGHVGVCYQAHNGVYLGRSTARTLHLLPSGAVFSARSAQKIRKRERGWEYAVEQLVSSGAPAPRGPLQDWLREVLARLRRLRHPGNHRYAWGLHPAVRRHLPSSQPYPRRSLS